MKVFSHHFTHEKSKEYVRKKKSSGHKTLSSTKFKTNSAADVKLHKNFYQKSIFLFQFHSWTKKNPTVNTGVEIL